MAIKATAANISSYRVLGGVALKQIALYIKFHCETGL
jgi:hypothetical protein